MINRMTFIFIKLFGVTFKYFLFTLYLAGSLVCSVSLHANDITGAVNTCLQNTEVGAQEDLERGTFTSLERSSLASYQIDSNLCVYLPAGYYESKVTYPIVYAIDNFDLTPLLADQQYSHRTPFIVVGIRIKDRDLLLDENFNNRLYQVMRTGIIPSIEDQLRVTPNQRTIFGHSIAGRLIGVILALDSNYQIFRNFVSSDGSFRQHSYGWKGQLKIHAERIKGNLIISGTSDGNGPSVVDFVEALKKSSAKDLRIQYFDLESESHYSSARKTFEIAIPLIFPIDHPLLESFVVSSNIGGEAPAVYAGNGLYFSELTLDVGNHQLEVINRNGGQLFDQFSLDIKKKGRYIARINTATKKYPIIAISKKRTRLQAYPPFLQASIAKTVVSIPLLEQNDGTFKASIELPAGLHGFRVTSESNPSINFGYYAPLLGQHEFILRQDYRPILFVNGQAGLFMFSVDGSNERQLRLKIINTNI